MLPYAIIVVNALEDKVRLTISQTSRLLTKPTPFYYTSTSHSTNIL